MGNQLTGDQQSGQVLSAVLTNLPQLIQEGETAPAHSKSLTKLRNSKFIRGDEGYLDSDGKLKQAQPNRTSSPIRGFNSDTKVSGLGLILGDSRAEHGATSQPNLGQIKTPNNRPEGNPVNKPFNIFQQLFGGDNQSERKLRSSSASHVSMSNSNRKMALLESNAQVSERKVQQLSKTIESLQNNLRNSESRLVVGEQNFQKIQNRSVYLESQVKNYQQEIANLNTLLNQKNSTLYQKDRQISELQLQTRTYKSQIQFQESRLNQYGLREQRKDKEIAQISQAKLELNGTKIRLESNLKIAEASLEEKSRKIEELESLISKKDRQIDVGNKQRTELENTASSLKYELDDSLSKHQSEIQSLHSTIRQHLMTIDEHQARILQLTHRVDKLYYQQIENQSTIAKLKDQCGEQLSGKEQVRQELNECRAQVESLRVVAEQAKQEKLNQIEIGERIMIQFLNAKKVGQKQIEFLESKLQQIGKEKQKLIQELEITRSIGIERNKVFERSVIYDLKQENNRLWEKLIAKSNKQSDLEAQEPDYWKNKIGQFKDNQKPELIEQVQDNKSLFEQRFTEFLKKLEGRQQVNKENKEKEGITRDISSNSLAELHESVAFYKQKCNELQKMVEDHIKLNKSLKEQVEKYTNYELAFQVYKTQLEDAKNRNKELTQTNLKLKSALNVDMLAIKIAEVQELLQQIKLLAKEVNKQLIPQLADKCMGIIVYCLAECEKLKKVK